MEQGAEETVEEWVGGEEFGCGRVGEDGGKLGGDGRGVVRQRGQQPGETLG